MSARLQPLLDLHATFDALLLRHRLALMAVDLAEAVPVFERFAASLSQHVADEDALVFPLYAAHPPSEGFERGASPAVFAADHENILSHLARLRAGLAALAPLEREAQPRACLALLDREKVFVDLLEHHDLRERRYLYPALELALSDEQKTELLARMLQSSKEPP